jgi:hypothetical protein
MYRCALESMAKQWLDICLVFAHYHRTCATQCVDTLTHGGKGSTSFHTSPKIIGLLYFSNKPRDQVIWTVHRSDNNTMELMCYVDDIEIYGYLSSILESERDRCAMHPNPNWRDLSTAWKITRKGEDTPRSSLFFESHPTTAVGHTVSSKASKAHRQSTSLWTNTSPPLPPSTGKTAPTQQTGTASKTATASHSVSISPSPSPPSKTPATGSPPRTQGHQT